MADAQISVELQAKIDAFVRNLLTAANTANSAASSTTQMSATISRNISNVNRLNLNQFTAALNAGTLSVNRLGTAVPAITRPIVAGANQAAFALTNLGRVAQDAPFGFIGIQNNLNPLFESFQRLKAETGSSSAALKALGSSLIGPAGFGIALSVVTAAITFANVGFGAYTRAFEKSKKATDDAKKSTDDYIQTLGQLVQVQVKGAQNAQKELTDLKVLYDAYQNANLPLEKRKDAYEQLQKQYPEYFKNLKFELSATTAQKSSYDQLTQSIIATARARAAADLITKNSTRQLENQQKINDLEKVLVKSRASDTGFADAFGGSRETLGIISQINDLKTDSNKLTEINLELTKSITSELLKGAKLPGESVGGVEDTGKKIKTLSEILKELRIALQQNELAFDDTFEEKRTKDIGSYQTAINELIKVGYKPATKAVQDLIAEQERLSRLLKNGDLPTANLSAPASLTPDRQMFGDKPLELGGFGKGAIQGLDKYQKLIQEAIASTERFNESIKNLSLETLGDGLSSWFAAIGEALANGTNDMDAFGQSILNAFAGFLAQLGQMFIQQGIASIAYGIALSTNPLTAAVGKNFIASGAGQIAAGAILSVAGGALSAKGKKGGASSGANTVRGFAVGGNNISGGLALVGERGPELLNIPTGANITNANRTSEILKGSARDNSVYIMGSFDLSMEKLSVKLKQVDKRLSRLGV